MMISNRLTDLSSETAFLFTRDYLQFENSKIFSVEVQFKTDYASLKQILASLRITPYVNRVVLASLEIEENDIIADIHIEFFTLNDLPTGTDYSFMTGTYPNSDLIS
jgi:hypothetical protein